MSPILTNLCIFLFLFLPLKSSSWWLVSPVLSLLLCCSILSYLMPLSEITRGLLNTRYSTLCSAFIWRLKHWPLLFCLNSPISWISDIILLVFLLFYSIVFFVGYFSVLVPKTLVLSSVLSSALLTYSFLQLGDHYFYSFIHSSVLVKHILCGNYCARCLGNWWIRQI